MPKKSASRREVLKKAGAITAPTSGASFAFAGDPEKAPGTPAEATVSKDSLGPSLGPRAVRPVGPGQTSRRRSRNRPEGARSRVTFQRIDETNPQGRGAVGISAVGTPPLQFAPRGASTFVGIFRHAQKLASSNVVVIR